MDNVIYLFGMGTGRCGTVSLSKLLDMQKNSYITHECLPGLPWNVDETSVANRVADMKNRAIEGNTIVGDVSLSNLTSSDMLLKALPNSKFIVMKRDKTLTINSFKKKWLAKNRYNRLRYKKNKWDSCYPSYNLKLCKALNKYYTEYYRSTSKLIKLYPNNFKCFNITCLNSMVGVKSILDFCEIPKRDIIYKINIRANAGRCARK